MGGRKDLYVRHVVAAGPTSHVSRIDSDPELTTIELRGQLGSDIDHHIVMPGAHVWLLAQLSTVELPMSFWVLERHLAERLLTDRHGVLALDACVGRATAAHEFHPG